ncbi:hypothetical protein [Phytobacter massiliensis]|uniref:Uncharacterized protein n=1 Tax=Phytobacter massiliensis TaxID=1485952 RepID=A0A6N3H9E7_9ENTR|nr:hypothetical protein [Phytobacter massiliensis]
MNCYWHVHKKGEIEDLFYPIRIGDRLCLILKNGGALYRQMKWWQAQRENIIAVRQII